MRFPSSLWACGLALAGPSAWSAGAAGESSGDIERQETLDQVLQSEISSAQDSEASAQEEQAHAAEDEIQAASAAIRARQASSQEVAAADANATLARTAGHELQTHLRDVNAELRRARREEARAAAALRAAHESARREAQELRRARHEASEGRGNATALQEEIRLAHAQEDQRLRDEAAQFQQDFNSRVDAVTSEDAARLRTTEARLERNLTAEEVLEVGARRRSAEVERVDEELRWWLMVVLGALAAALVAASALCAMALRMRRQRSYHMSMMFRLNSERIRCIERIKELRVPILAAEEARISGSTGGF